MSDSSSIPTQPGGAQATTTQLKLAAAPFTVTVADAPQTIYPPPEILRLEGATLPRQPGSDTVTIRTEAGDVTVKTGKQVPPDSRVRIELRPGADTATLTILRQKTDAAQAQLQAEVVETIAQNLPELRPGATITAVEANPQTSAATPAPSQAAQTAAQDPPGITQAEALAAVREVAAALRALPVAENAPQTAQTAAENIDATLARILVSRLQAQVTQATIAETQPATTQAQPENAAPALQDIGRTLIELAALPSENLPTDVRPVQALAQAVSGAQTVTLATVEVEQVLQPGAPQPTTQPPVQTGVIDSVLPDGRPVVTAASGQTFIFQAVTDTQPGAQIVFTITGETQQPVTPATLASLTAGGITTGGGVAAPAFHPLFSQSWPALQDSLNVLAQVAPQVAQAVQTTMPAPAPRLVPTALFFLAALRAGAVEAWLGERPLSALRDAGRRDLVDRLTGDFSRIARQAGESVSGDWRIISMPLLHDEQVSNMQFYLRQQAEEDGEGPERDGKRTRFVLNLKLSNIGDLQIDGLLHKKQLDVIIRTDDRLPADIRQEILQKYAEGLEQASLKGSMAFHHDRKGWVTVPVSEDGEGVTV